MHHCHEDELEKNEDHLFEISSPRRQLARVKQHLLGDIPIEGDHSPYE